MPWVNDPYEWIDPEIGRTESLWVNPKPPPTANESLTILKPHLEALFERDRRFGVSAGVVQAAMVERFNAQRLSEIPASRIPEAIEFFSTFQPTPAQRFLHDSRLK